MNDKETVRPRIVILGGGYGGVSAAREMIRRGVHKQARITLVNDSNFHYLTTLMHYAILKPIDDEKVSIFLPEFLGSSIDFIRATVVRIDAPGNRVVIKIRENEGELEYDYLIVALGWEPDYYNIPGLKEHAFVLHDIQNAHEIHDHIEKAFASYDKDPSQTWIMHILIGGASYTGIEIAAEVADLVPVLARKYSIDPAAVKISMVGIFLPEFDNVLANHAMNYLRQRGIDVRAGTMIERVEAQEVKFQADDAMRPGLVIWAGGIRANDVAGRSGLECDKKGRVVVDELLRCTSHKNIFVIGDCARAVDNSGRPLAQTAQFAAGQGEWLARSMGKILSGQTPKAYAGRNLGMFLSVGRKAGLGVLYVGKHKFRFTGYIARLLKKGAGYRYLWSIGGVRLVVKKLLA